MSRMTPDEAISIAQQRIAAAWRSRAEVLDLGDLSLETLPAELGEIESLRVLGLGYNKPTWACSEIKWELDYDRSPSPLRDLSPLAGLINVQSLDFCACGSLNDLSPLAGLTSLQSLELSGCESLNNLSPLAGLTSLQSLDLSGCGKLSDLSPLTGLTSLQSLDLSWCESLSDLSPLTGLTLLQLLDLSGCKRLSDLSPLAGLSRLQSLGLGWCEGLSALSPLAGLSSLQSLILYGCKSLSDLSPLAGLTNLQSLGLSGCKSLSDVSPLAGLTNLQKLGLSECNVSDLSPLAGLNSLQSLDLRGGRQLAEFGPLLQLLPTLNTLDLYGSRFADLPVEVCGNEYFDNVIDKVRAHYADLGQGASEDAELKVCVLGNGGVGKTQLCRRLSNLPFDETVSTTHGIQLGHYHESLPNVSRAVRLNLWDFGGQDIYHGAHALFLHGQAVFVLLWTPDLEMGEFTEGGVIMRYRPLAYWLDYIRGLAGTDCPVLVVQSQCDEPGRRASPPASPIDFCYLRILEFSAKTDLGLELLQAQIKEAARDLLARRPSQQIGVGRAQVRDELRRRLEQDQQRPLDQRQHRTLTQDRFRRLCKKTGKISDPDALLDYLHQTGVVFFREQLFDGKIVLDQTWALEAIYTLFDRRRTHAYFTRSLGRFTRSELEQLVWQGYSQAEQELFLSLMESCGICFRVCKVNGGGTSDVTQRELEYIAPELLPEWSDAQEQLLGRLRQDAPGAEAEVRYHFLHEGVLRSFLSRIGKRAADHAIYWKYGCWFYEQSTRSQVLIQHAAATDPVHPSTGSIKMKAWGDDPVNLLEPLVEVLLSIPLGHAPEVQRSWDAVTGAGSLFQKRFTGTGRSRKPAYEGIRKREPALQGAEPEPMQLPADPLASLRTAALPREHEKPRPEIFISFAWGDEQNEAGRQRQETVEQLAVKLEQWGYHAVLDKNGLRNGDLISGFMKRIGRADRVLVILSEKYLRSPYCLTELHHVFNHSLHEKDEFLRRIIPLVLDDAKFDGWRDRRGHAQYWRNEYEEMQAALHDLGSEDVGSYHLIRCWHATIGDMLAFISDKLTPRGFEQMKANDFAAIREMLQTTC